MKATGIVRRIDDLGRIVIPKEIRKNLKINKGDSLEIYVNEEEIILRKYSFFEDTLGIAKKLLTSFNKIYNKCLIVTDKEKVIASNNSNYVNKSINDSIKKSIENRVDVLGKNLFDINSYYLVPIIIDSDAVGSIIIIDSEIDDCLINVIKLLSYILIKNIEE